MATSMSHESNDRAYESYWYVAAAYTSLPDVIVHQLNENSVVFGGENYYCVRTA